MKKDVMVGMLSYDSRIDIAVTDEIRDGMEHPDCSIKYVATHSGDSLVTRARNSVISSFLDYEDVEYLMFIDSDIHFKWENVNTLRKRDKPIIGGMCMKKKLPYEVVFNHALGHEGVLTKVREVGSGFMMIRKDVLKKMIKAYPERHYIPYPHERQSENYYDFFHAGVDSEHGVYLSEDYFFCKLAREVGFDIYLDTEVLLKHRGNMMFPTEDMDILLTADMILKTWGADKNIDPSRKEVLRSIRKSIDQIVGSSITSGYLLNSSFK